MSKKFHYKTPAIIALTIAGTAITTHQAFAQSNSDATKSPSTTSNVNQNQQPTSSQTNQTQTTAQNNTNTVAGTQTYKDPTQVQPKTTQSSTNYDSKLDQLYAQANTQKTTQAAATQNTNQTNTQTQAQTQQKTAQPTANQTTTQQAAQQKTAAQPTVNQTTTQQAAQQKTAAQPTVNQTTTQQPAQQKTAVQQKATQPTANQTTTYAARSVAPTTTTRSAQPTTYAATATPLPKYQPRVNSSINDYIRKQNYTVPTYEQDYSSNIPKYSYRYGKPEGIVIHDTANEYSTLNNEVAYMKNNWQNAFVHGFVDGNRIVETANTDYLAWGAGPVANQRYIHMELVHTHDKDAFARQMNNIADYAATNLQYYGLKPDSAEYDGQGTVWTHKAVSNFLGGTDHTDPHGYLQSRGYNYDALYDLINEKYQIKQGLVAPWGSSYATAPSTSTTTTKPSTTTKPATSTNSQLKVIPVDSLGRLSSTNHGIYKTVYDKAGVQNSTLNNQTYRLTKKALLGDKSFYLISDYNKGTNFGWVQTGDLTYKVGQPVTTNTATYGIQAGTKLYSTPWGTDRQVAASVSGTGTQAFKASKQTEVSPSKYVYGSVNGKSGWVDSAKLSSYTAPKTTVSAPNTQVKGTFTATPSKTTTKAPATTTKTAKPAVKATTAVKAPSTATKVVNTVKSAVKSTANAVQPTAKAATKPSATQTVQSTKAPLNKTVVVNKLGQYVTDNYGLRASVYDKTGAKAAQYLGYTYNISRERNQDGTLYYLLQNNGLTTPLGWVNAKDVKVANQGKVTPTSSQYTVNTKNNGLYTTPWGTQKQLIDPLKTQNSTFNASKRTVVNNTPYVYGTVNGKTGWVAENTLTPKTTTANRANTATQQQQPAVKYNHDYIVTSTGGSYYNKPNGQVLGSLKDQYGNIVTVFEKQLVNGITWYHGTLANGQIVWLKSADVRDTLTRTNVSSNTLNQAVAKQVNSPWKPQVQHIAGQWVNASQDEVKTAMDPKTISQDATQRYQFLRLDKAQNLSADSVNKLLKGKGILEGQGAAFAQAAQTYDINEIYLISHALLETGNGTSALANGGYVDANNKVVTNSSKKYYNMFGIGAIDTDAVRGGFKTAANYGWDSVSKAIIGGAKFITSDYLDRGQNTLYRMRWNPASPASHQYATDISWASQNATRMKHMYDQIGEAGKYFDEDIYKA